MDWNWFFSAVAQSTAALIGFFGAFLVSKLIDTQSKYRDSIQKMRSLINKSLKLKSDFSSKDFQRYNDLYSRKYLKRLKRRNFDSENEYEPKDVYREAEFSPFERKTRSLQKIKNTIQEAETMDVSDFSLQAAVSVSNSQSRKKFENRFKSEVNDLISETKFHIRKIENLETNFDRITFSKKVINGSLIIMSILFVVGIIYPLGMLPFDNSQNFSFSSLSIDTLGNHILSPKGILLALIAFIFIASLLGAYFLNKKNAVGGKLLKDLNKCSDLKYYSRYLGYMEKKA